MTEQPHDTPAFQHAAEYTITVTFVVTGGKRPRTAGRAEVERETASWVHWFNTARLHSSIDYCCSPVEYEQHYYQRTRPTASTLEVA